jgi:hypothetical protein
MTGGASINSTIPACCPTNILALSHDVLDFQHREHFTTSWPTEHQQNGEAGGAR